MSAPLDIMLELLVPHAADVVVKTALQLVKSPSDKVRRIVALHLASVGRTETIPVLRELLQDKDGYVRGYVCIGAGRAVTDHRADDEFRRKAYDITLPQVDQVWGGGGLNDSARYLVILDRERAARDLVDERWLNLSNNYAYQILEALNDAGIVLPEPVVRKMLEGSLPLSVGKDCYPNNYVAAAALKALAATAGRSAKSLIESLSEHENDKIREASAEALIIIGGLKDPVGWVHSLVAANGYESLTHEQRVVYCAFLFDAEVCNGGLMQFFGNSSGDHAADTVDALRELGHTVGGEVLATAMRHVGPLAREKDLELRLSAIESRFDQLRSLFDPLESNYYETASQLRQAWLLYATRHPDHFQDRQ
jgi:hypothetical protein